MTSECLFSVPLHTSPAFHHLAGLPQSCWSGSFSNLLSSFRGGFTPFLHRSPRCPHPVAHLPHSRAFGDPPLPAGIDDPGDPGVQGPCHVTKMHFSDFCLTLLLHAPYDSINQISIFSQLTLFPHPSAPGLQPSICTRSLASSLALHSTCVSSFVLQSIFRGQELAPHAPVRHSLSTGCRRVNQEEAAMPHCSDSRRENIPVACEHWCGRLTARGEAAAGSFGVGQKDRQFHRQRTS